MSTPPQKTLSALKLAKQVSSFAVEIHVKDVQELIPEWTREQAEQFLRRREGEIAERMLREGLKAIVELGLPEVNDGR